MRGPPRSGTVCSGPPQHRRPRRHTWLRSQPRRLLRRPGPPRRSPVSRSRVPAVSRGGDPWRRDPRRRVHGRRVHGRRDPRRRVHRHRDPRDRDPRDRDPRRRGPRGRGHRRSGRRRLSRPRLGPEAGRADGRPAARAAGPGRDRAIIRSVPRRRVWARPAPPRRMARRPKVLRRMAVRRMAPRRVPVLASQLVARAPRVVAGSPAVSRVPRPAEAVQAARQQQACPVPVARARAR